MAFSGEQTVDNKVSNSVCIHRYEQPFPLHGHKIPPERGFMVEFLVIFFFFFFSGSEPLQRGIYDNLLSQKVLFLLR